MTGFPFELERLRGTLRTALVSDALDSLGHNRQCLGPGFVALDPRQVMVGFAFPVTIERVDAAPEVPYVGLLHALDAIGADEIYVSSSGTAPDAAIWGELISTACNAAGAAGALCDGYIRDSGLVRRLGFPCFSRGRVPYDINGRFEVTGFGAPVTIDGIEIRRHDLLVGDADGVVVVPGDVRDEAIAIALAKAGAEDSFRASVAGGMKPSEAYALHKVL